MSRRQPRPSSPAASTRSAEDLRVDHDRRLFRDDVKAGKVGSLECTARVTLRRRILDGDRTTLVVADEEDGATALVRLVVLDETARNIQGDLVAVVVDGAPVTALPAVGAVTDGKVERQQAVEDVP